MAVGRPSCFFPCKPDVSSLKHKTWEIHVDVLYLHCGHRLGITVIVSDRHSFTKISSHLICVKQSPKNVMVTASTCAILLSNSMHVPNARTKICGNDICNWKKKKKKMFLIGTVKESTFQGVVWSVFFSSKLTTSSLFLWAAVCTYAVRHERHWVVQGAPPKAASSVLWPVQRIAAETPGVSKVPTSNSMYLCNAA